MVTQFMTTPKEASSELPHPPWVVYKVILPAKLLSIKGDKLYCLLHFLSTLTPPELREK